MNIRFSKVEIILILADIIENQPAFKELTDDEGYLVIPSDKYDNFCYDMGLVLGRVLERIAKPESPDVET